MTDTLQTLRIGEVARQTGLTVETLRYYEQVGLLPLTERSASGFRCYAPDVVARIQFIKRAQGLGLSLEEIRSIGGDASQRKGDSCRHVHDILTRHIADVDQRLADLHELRNALSNYRHRCEAALGTHIDTPCPTVDALKDSQT